MMLDHGRPLHDGLPPDVCNRFYEFNDERIISNRAGAGENRWRRKESSGEIELETISLHLLDGTRVLDVEYGDDFIVRMQFRAHRLVKQPVFGIGFHTTDFIYLATNHIDEARAPTSLAEGLHQVECRIRHMPLLPRTYAIRVGIAVGTRRDTAFYVENALIFRVVAAGLNRATPDVAEGFISVDTEWNVKAARQNPHETSDAEAPAIEIR